jgi:hypothetical protein
MAHFDRDFNPYEFDNYDDEVEELDDEGDEIILPRDNVLPAFGINELDNPVFSTKLDGIQIISDTPYIAKICKTLSHTVNGTL